MFSDGLSPRRACVQGCDINFSRVSIFKITSEKNNVGVREPTNPDTDNFEDSWWQVKYYHDLLDKLFNVHVNV